MEDIYQPEIFSKALYEIMKELAPAIRDMELYEFQYALKNIAPVQGWESIQPAGKRELETRLNSRSFYDSIQIKPRLGDRIVLDEHIVQLTDMLFVGLVNGLYDEAWVRHHFYFDIRGFYFLHRTIYFTQPVITHLGRDIVFRVVVARP